MIGEREKGWDGNNNADFIIYLVRDRVGIEIQIYTNTTNTTNTTKEMAVGQNRSI